MTIVKAPAGWERVLQAAERYNPALTKEMQAALLALQGRVSVDEIVRALEGSTEALTTVLAAATLTPSAFAAIVDMATAAGRESWRMVLNEAGAGTVGPFRVDFRAIDQLASDWAAEHSASLVTRIDEETRAALRSIFTRAPVEGITVQEQARLIRQVVGLNERQAMAVLNRYDGLLRSGSSAFDAARLSSKYEMSLLRERALMIARTESRNASVAGQRLSWEQAAADGFIDTGEALQEWSAASDACDECAELDGQTWPFDVSVPDGPHPNCLPADSLVTPSGRVVAVIERVYDGNLVVIGTAGGAQLRLTPNHPVLTWHGWVPAGRLMVGDYVVRGRGVQGISGDHVYYDNVPATIEQVAVAFRRSCDVPAVPVPITPVDFHGDGVGSKIAVVWADSLLRDRFQSPFGEHLAQGGLGGGHIPFPIASYGGGSALKDSGLLLATAGGIMAGRHLSGPFLERHPAPPKEFGFAATPRTESGLKEPKPDDRAGYPEFVGASLFRNSGEVTLDKIVRIQFTPFHGPVLNLETSTGYYHAETIVVHNCRCSVSLTYDAKLPEGFVPPEQTQSFKASAVVSKPLGQYADWDACIADMAPKIGVEAARRYCGRLRSLIEG